MKKISKKSKIISLGAISTIALAVIPVAVVACSSDSNDSKDMNNFISSFKNNTFKIAVLNASTILPSAIPTTLTSSNINTYFSNIPSAPSGITLIYSTTSDDTTGTITLNVSASQSGVTTQNASITFKDLLSTNQNIINNFINAFNNSANSEKTMIAGINTIAASSIPTTISSSDINTYFSNLPSIASGSTSPITLSYSVSNVNVDLGQVSLNVTVSATNASTVKSKPITVIGFMTSHQVNQNALKAIIAKLKAVILKATTSAASQKPNDVYKDLQIINPLTLASFTPYFNTAEIETIISGVTGLNVTYSINPVTSSFLENGQISFNMNLTLGSGTAQVSENTNLLVNGFATAKLTQDQTTQLASLDALATKLNNLPLSALDTQTTNTPSVIYNDLKTNSSLVLNDFNAYFSTSTISTTLATVAGVSVSYSLVQPTTDNLHDGTFNILVTLSLGAEPNIVTTTAILTINGFLNANQAAINSYIVALNSATNIRGNSSILPSTLPLTTSLSSYLINLPTLTSNQITLSYSFSKPNDDFGSVDLVISVSAPGVKPVQSNSMSITGFLNTNQNAVNNYINEINKNSSLITGTNTQLPSTLTATTIGSYIKGLPTNSNGLNISYIIKSFNNVTGSVTLHISVSGLNVSTQSSNLFTINGFKIESIQSLLSSITSSDFNTSLASNNVFPVQNGTSLALPIWMSNANNSSTELISGLPFSLIKSYTISNWNPAFGYAYMTILANDGASTKILLTNIGSSTFYSTNITQIQFSASATAITPKTFNKIPIKADSTLSTIFGPLGINIASTNSQNLYYGNYMFPYVTGYQLNQVGTNTNKSVNLSITLDFTNPINNDVTTNTYTINGSFLPSDTNPLDVLNTSLVANSPYGNYWSTTNSTPGLGNSATTNSLYFSIPGSTTSEFKSDATVATSGTTLPSFLVNNINWPVGYSDANVVSWTETGDNTTGIATYVLTLNTTNSTTKTAETATLKVSGFMTTANASTLAGINANKVSNISSLQTPSNGDVTNSTQGLENVGISKINWNNLSDTLFGGGLNSYSIINANATAGTLNFLFHFKNGVVLSILVSGYSTVSLAETIVSPITPNIVAPSNGTLTPIQAKQYFTFTNSTPNIESTFKTIVISNSNGEGTLNLAITNNNDVTVNFTVSGFLNIVSQAKAIQYLIGIKNNTSSLLNIATIFPNGNSLVLTAKQLLDNAVPSWVIIPNQAKVLIRQLINDGVVENNITLTIMVTFTPFRYPGSGNFSSPTVPLISININNHSTSFSVPASIHPGTIFESAQQYLENSGIFNLALNKEILNKQTISNFIKTLTSTNNSATGTSFMGTISPNGSFTGGYYGDVDNMGDSKSLYTSAQWSTITSLFNITLQNNILDLNLNSSNSDINWYSLVNIVAQQQANGILVRAYFGWNVYVDTLIPNSDFITPSVDGMITSNVAELVKSGIKNNQSLDVFSNNSNKPISFTLNDIPSWIAITQAQINSILASTSYTPNDINVTIGLPTYSYPPAVGSTNSSTTSQISVSINNVENSTSVASISNFAPAISLFQSVTSISLNPNMFNLTLTEFMDQYVKPNNFGNGANKLNILNNMFNITILPTWFSQFNVNSISWAVINLNSTGTSLSVQIYIQGNIWTTVNIPVNMFKHTLNTNETITNNIAKSIATNIISGTSLKEFTSNKPITFTLNNIPSWINNASEIQKLATGQNLSDISITIALPSYAFIPTSGNATDSNTLAQISVSLNNGDTSYAITSNFESARTYFQTITTLSLQSAYASMSSDALWAELSKTAISTGTNDLTLIQQYFNITIPSSIFSQWNINNITWVKATNEGSNGIQIQVWDQSNVWAIFVVAANAQSQIANEIAQSVVANTSLTNFTNSSTPITFTLNDIPNWILNQSAIKALIPTGKTASDVSVSFAIPSYTAPTATNLASMTSSVITVTIDGVSATSTTNNFESAQSYFANSGIVSATLKDPSQYANITDLYNKIVSAGLSQSSETINSDGSTTNSAGTSAGGQSIFDISIKNNIFNWSTSSMNYVTCAIVGNTITLRIFIQGNVWYDTTFTPSSLPTPTSSTSK